MADLVLPAGGGRPGRAARQGQRRQAGPRPAENRLDAVWLAKLAERGMLRPSFVPPAGDPALRDYTRLRTDLTRERTPYRQRLDAVAWGICPVLGLAAYAVISRRWKLAAAAVRAITT
jgi:hypothetical protein